MYRDEADRVAAQIRRTIPVAVAHVIEIENRQPLCLDTWAVKCYEARRPFGASGAPTWITTIGYWIHLQGRWIAEGKQQDTQS